LRRIEIHHHPFVILVLGIRQRRHTDDDIGDAGCKGQRADDRREIPLRCGLAFQ
jgi:hypothetical protein